MDSTDEDEQSDAEEANECSELEVEYDKTSEIDGREERDPLQEDNKKSFVQSTRFEESRLDIFNHELKLLFVEVNIVTDWIAKNFGIELIDKTSPLFKHIHESAEIELLTQALSLLEKKKKILRRSSRRKTIKTVATSSVREYKEKSGRNCRKQRIATKEKNENGHLQFSEAHDAVETEFQKSTKRRKSREWSVSEKERNVDKPKEDVRDVVDGEESANLFSVEENTSNNELQKKKYIWKPATQPMQCEECGKILKGDSSLRCHMLMHADLRPYECRECGKRFRNKTKLGQHALIHNAEKSEKCKFCGRGFLRKKDLIIHERTHTGEKPFSCNHCQKSFNIKEHLTIHLRVHTGEKPYRCEVCSKAFSQANSLRIHKKIHLKLSGADTKPKAKKPRVRIPKKRSRCQLSSEKGEKISSPLTLSSSSNKLTVNSGHKSNTVKSISHLQIERHANRNLMTQKPSSNSKIKKAAYDHHPKEEQFQTSQAERSPPLLSLLQQQPQSTQTHHHFSGHGPNAMAMTPEQQSILVQSFFQAQHNPDTPWHFSSTSSSVANMLQEDNQCGALSHPHSTSPHTLGIHHPHIVSGFKFQQGYPTPPHQHNSMIRSGLTVNAHHNHHQSNILNVNPFGVPQYHDSGQAFRHFSH